MLMAFTDMAFLTSFRALKAHPDKGGDKEKYQALQNAYEVLADEDKRQV
jgi:curved DNA-binding protein CbpA